MRVRSRMQCMDEIVDTECAAETSTRVIEELDDSSSIASYDLTRLTLVQLLAQTRCIAAAAAAMAAAACARLDRDARGTAAPVSGLTRAALAGIRRVGALRQGRAVLQASTKRTGGRRGMCGHDAFPSMHTASPIGADPTVHWHKADASTDTQAAATPTPAPHLIRQLLIIRRPLVLRPPHPRPLRCRSPFPAPCAALAACCCPVTGRRPRGRSVRRGPRWPW